LKALIENTYEINNNTKVVVMGHSMGANFMQAFLAYFVDQTWKDKYIATLISLGGSYKGVANAYKFIEGDSYSIPLLKSRTMAPIIRQLSSMLWMLPPLDNKDFSVFTPQKNYTNADLKQLIFDLNSTVSWDMYNYQMDSGDRLKSPGVPVHCIYGYDLPTGYGKYFSSLNPPDSEEGKWLSGGDGDSVVPTYSLAACMELAKGQDQPVKEYKLDKAHHVDMVFAPHVWDIITSIVTK
jgi:lysophospholipase-3